MRIAFDRRTLKLVGLFVAFCSHFAARWRHVVMMLIMSLMKIKPWRSRNARRGNMALHRFRTEFKLAATSHSQQATSCVIYFFVVRHSPSQLNVMTKTKWIKPFHWIESITSTFRCTNEQKEKRRQRIVPTRKSETLKTRVSDDWTGGRPRFWFSRPPPSLRRPWRS